MIDSKLYFEFNEIASDDYSEQVKFFEKNLYFLEKPESLDEILSRKEFMRIIIILENCSFAYSELNDHKKALEISNKLVRTIERNKSKFNLDLNNEYYYLSSLFAKGKSLYYLKKYNEAEQTFMTLLEYDIFKQIDSINWFIDSKYSRIFSFVNASFLITAIILFSVSNLVTTFSQITEILLEFFGFALLVSLYWEPSKLIKYFLYKKYLKKYNKKSKLQNEPIEFDAERKNLDSRDYTSILESGIENYHKNQYEEAIKDLSLALSINPNSKDALYCRADSYFDIKSFNESIMDYTRLIELDISNVAEIYASRGNAYLELKQYDLALNDYNKAIELEPHYSLFKFYRAFLFQTTNKFQEAIVDYDCVIELNPKDYVALTNRGEAYYEVGNIVRARLDFMKAKEMGYQDAIDNLKKFNLE